MKYVISINPIFISLILSLFQAVQAQNNKSHFSQCDDKQDLSAMFPSAAIVKVIIYDYYLWSFMLQTVKYKYMILL